jgi:filamentous hemagglutinin
LVVGDTGIHDWYKVNRRDVDYVMIEYKFVGPDNKTGADYLKPTNDGKQGSLSWMLGSGRIEKAVGGGPQADAVRDALKQNRVESWVVTVRPDGSTSVQVLDALGRVKPVETSKILDPLTNLSGARK